MHIQYRSLVTIVTVSFDLALDADNAISMNAESPIILDYLNENERKCIALRINIESANIGARIPDLSLSRDCKKLTGILTGDALPYRTRNKTRAFGKQEALAGCLIKINISFGRFQLAFTIARR